MERARRLISDSVAYEPLEDSVEDDTDTEHPQSQPQSRFSRLEYGVFFLLGISMLWAW
jgi:equilibrative nucleoside transporter 1/2/3